MHVVCAGHVNWDVTIRLDRLPVPDGESRVRDRYESGGGSAANVAVTLVALEHDASLVGSVGDDATGRQALDTLVEAGVDVSPVLTAPGDTARKYLLVDAAGEVSVIDDGGVNEAVGPEDVEASWVAGADHLHLTGQRPATAARLAELAVEHDLRVSFDPGRLLDRRDYDETLALTDLLFLNDREATEVARGTLPEDCVVLTKHGERGASLVAPDETLEHSGVDLPAVDATGAGDAFAAGFIAASGRGTDRERSLAVANACGALAASSEGPRPDVSWERIEGLL
ncbi:PfkB family carbohydrate kinase [Salinirubellus salinus]|uniref:PfkB family carbohydrate kinase n=1 Tax=Salinirubellus salinus TaxID=1364945 RepID=A0A9E7QZG1_9EURY|nr:PfkB family carbohydrate kinase [Salinirubellus salinus]UWM52812.1 PfkB family carbohydrate kinase [Salinirubellus salinus]